MDLLIFDLDGTLIDSKLDLAQAVNQTRSHFGMAPLDNERVYSFVGNGAPALIRRAMGEEAGEARVAAALEYFLDYYAGHSLDHTVLYPGVRESLDQLRGAGKTMAVLTNKPAGVSRAILKGLDVDSHFLRIYGGNSFERKKPDPMGVDALLAETGAARERTMMVGDSAVDIATARNARIQACGVTYGFQPESLADPQPDLVVDRMEDLARWILKGNSQTA